MPERYQDSDRIGDVEVGTTLRADILERNLPAMVRAKLTDLTDKQRDYSVLYAHGIDKVIAYATAYGAKEGQKYGSVRTRSYQVANNKNVKAAVALIAEQVADRIKLGVATLEKARSDSHLSGRTDGEDPDGFEDAITLAVETRERQRQSQDGDEPTVTREWVIERLTEEAKNLKNSGSVRVRALELVGKAEGLFEDTLTVKDERPDSAAAAANQLAALLAEVRQGIARRHAVADDPAARRLALTGEVEEDEDLDRD